MKKYLLSLLFISSVCSAHIPLHTKLTLNDGVQTIEKNVSFVAEAEKQSEVIVDDCKIVYKVTPEEEKFCCEFEIYQSDDLIAKPTLIITSAQAGTIKLGEHTVDGLEKEFSFFVEIE